MCLGLLDCFILCHTCHSAAGHNTSEVKEQFKSLKHIVGAFMLRRTKSKLIQTGNLILPPLTEITVYVLCLLLH